MTQESVRTDSAGTKLGKTTQVFVFQTWEGFLTWRKEGYALELSSLEDDICYAGLLDTKERKAV